jgi:hypothetical protein
LQNKTAFEIRKKRFDPFRDKVVEDRRFLQANSNDRLSCKSDSERNRGKNIRSTIVFNDRYVHKDERLPVIRLDTGALFFVQRGTDKFAFDTVAIDTCKISSSDGLII